MEAEIIEIIAQTVLYLFLAFALFAVIIHGYQNWNKVDKQNKGASQRRYEQTERLEESIRRRRK